eukprot:SAG22_NODE_4462_length_1261_cov_1.198795_2_plen_214_part_00
MPHAAAAKACFEGAGRMDRPQLTKGCSLFRPPRAAAAAALQALKKDSGGGGKKGKKGSRKPSKNPLSSATQAQIFQLQQQLMAQKKQQQQLLNPKPTAKQKKDGKDILAALDPAKQDVAAFEQASTAVRTEGAPRLSVADVTREGVPIGAHQWQDDGPALTVVLQATALVASQTVVEVLEAEVRCTATNALGERVQWRLQLFAPVDPKRSSWQ